jgi:hypothetical protein
MKIVLCEGKEDLLVVRSICNASGIGGITVETCLGRNNLESYLREIPKRPEFTRGEVESLAVLIDAEKSGASAWQKIQNAVKLGFGVQLQNQGDFLGESPRIAGFVISGADGNGMLEDLCLEAVSGRAGYPCLLQYFKCLAEKTEVQEYHAKAKFRAWMASQTDFELGVSLAADKGYIPWESPSFDPLRGFLRNV